MSLEIASFILAIRKLLFSEGGWAGGKLVLEVGSFHEETLKLEFEVGGELEMLGIEFVRSQVRWDVGDKVVLHIVSAFSGSKTIDAWLKVAHFVVTLGCDLIRG